MNIERMKKNELVSYCKEIGIDHNQNKKGLVNSVNQYVIKEISQSIKEGTDFELLKYKINALANNYASNLKLKITDRKKEMESDDNSHYLIYRVLGISVEEGKLIDEYQNTGRFLYKYAGSFLEEAASICLFFANPSGSKTTVENTLGTRPKRFEIDFLNNNDAVEIKWRDATTDGDHITKEHTRVNVIKNHGYKPIRVMFYYPQRTQAKRIQETLKTLYKGIDGEYYAGDEAWEYIQKTTKYDLKAILEEIAIRRDHE